MMIPAANDKGLNLRPASSSIVLIMKAFYWTRFPDANRTTLRSKTLC